eukprot:TRINITY_DN4227_c1_g1_i14.p1 TRINITY_DN4227_c1_g1~~TRINITY_DN4227_c1_g1_i14.p1  ORF type:complete len:719 (+),score=105.36 TRINITY_DN4227_c1_g1_i14:239-2158(+)
MIVDVEDTQSQLKTAPLQVIFKNLQYIVNIPRKAPSSSTVSDRLFGEKIFDPKTILHGIKGIFRPGRLTAIMGASGSGKTSVLNLVAGQLSSVPQGATLSGHIVVNGQELELRDPKLSKICGYVQQDDIIMDTMTVREAITFAALLRLPQEMSHKAKLERVEQVIRLMHLEKCADSIIGSHLIKGISGGERKRVSVAMVMITNPSILYLDEPTSGLDAFTAFSIVRTMRNVARSGRTVACTIHQPSSEIMGLFDDLLLLSEGKVIYHGPAKKMVPYFGTLGYQCPRYTNPADYLFMSIINDVKSESEPQAKTSLSTEQKEKLEGFAKQWLTSTDYQQNVEHFLQKPEDGGVSSGDVLENAPFPLQFQLLALRAFRNAVRNKLMVVGRAAQTIILALIFGLIYLQLDDDQRGVQNRQGSLFFVVVQGVFGATMGVLTVFANEKAVFLREYRSGLYKLPAYFFSRTLVELPFRIFFPVLGAEILYWMAGYQDVASKVVLFAVTMILLENAGSALGIFVASFFEDIAVALTILPVFLMPLMIFSGLLVNNGTVPAFLNWIKWISPMKYGFVALIKNEFEGLKLMCDPSQGPCTATNGEEVIKLLSFDDQGSVGVNLIVLFAMYFAFLALAYFALSRQINKKK